MKNKLFKSIGLAVLFLTLLVSNVFAFSFGTTDGVWGRIDSTTNFADGATCERYGRITPESFTPIDTLGIINNVNVGPGGENEKYVRNPGVCQGDPDGDIRFANNADFDGWTRSDSNNGRWSGLGVHVPTPPCTTVPDLFISEYVYQLRNDNNDDRIAIEIYNGTGGDINLSLSTAKYSLLLFKDDRNYDKVDLTGNVTAGDVYVVVSSTVGSSQTDHRDQTITINESYRTVVLVKDFVGPSSYTYGDENSIPGIYGGNTDENQVRYGSGSSGCPDADGSDRSAFALQSGFGFNGQIDTEF